MACSARFEMPKFNPFSSEIEKNDVKSESYHEVITELEAKRHYSFMTFKTTQKNVPIPTRELMKLKECDFRINAIICILSNVDLFTKVGSNVRYTSLPKFDRNLDSITELLGLTKKQIRSELNKLLEQNSPECSLIVREHEGRNIDCIQMGYNAGGFVLVPVNVLEDSLLNVSNIAFKMFLNLLWLCKNRTDYGYEETLVYQDTLLKCMGYKSGSRKLITNAGKELEVAGLISIRHDYDCKTIVVDGKIRTTTPKKQCFYNILI